MSASSCGEFFPILSYCIGSADRRVAEYCGVRRDSFNAAGHADDLRRMKRAETIADVIFASRRGGTSWVDGDVPPDSGYIASVVGCETRINSIDGKYRDVYAAVVDKLESIDTLGWADRRLGVGWWTPVGHNDYTFIDVSVHFADRDEALAFAERADQAVVYGIAEGGDIDLRYA